MSRPPLGRSFDILGLTIPWYGLLILSGILIGLFLTSREEKRLGLPRDTTTNLLFWALPLGLLGARLYYVAFTWGDFVDDPLSILYVWEGGLAIYGAVLGGLLAAWIVSKRGGFALPTLLDACAPSLILAQAIGRWGNYANVEAYGARIHDAAAQFFPLAVEVEIGGRFYWHMATFFYESVCSFIIFIILMAFRKRSKRRGDVFLWYALLYGAARLVIEGLRDDSLMFNVSGAQVRASQILSALMCLAVLIVFFIRMRKRRPRLLMPDALCALAVPLGLVCTFLGEFERNAYSALFVPAQIALALLMGLDVVFLLYYQHRAKRVGTPGAWAIALAALCALTLILGIGRLEASNAGFVTLRQGVAMLHLILSGAWCYLRAGKPRQEAKLHA